MTWTCEHIEERLTEFTDRLLSPAERESFTAHLGRCPKCMSLVKRVDAMTKAMHAIEPLEPPARLVFAILDKTSRAEPWWHKWVLPGKQSRFAMGLVTVAMLLLVLTPAMGIQWRELTWSDLKPGNLYNALDRRANLVYARGMKFVNEMRVVVEIQNMLQPVSESQKSSPESSPGEKEEEKPGQKTNRAREFEYVVPVSLAALHYGLPGRNQ